MKMTIDMPNVSQCGVKQCVYNTNNQCHAKAITVGNGVHPGCDTFFEAAEHSRERLRISGVGACKVRQCRHNDDYGCTAEKVSVGFADRTVQCLTFVERESLKVRVA